MTEKTRTLYCEIGKHEYEAPVKKGARPKNCPEHKPTAGLSGYVPRIASAAAIAAAVKQVASERPFDAQRCKCGITENTTEKELKELRAGCTAGQGYTPGWVCPFLDAVRRKLGK